MLMPTGFLYDDPERANMWMDERMELFRETKRSVLEQEGKFRWVISLDKRTPHRHRDEIADDSRIKLITTDIRDAFKEIQPKKEWVITSRLDCDDQYQPGFVQAIALNFAPKLKVIDVKFEELEWETGRVHEGKERYSGSMFISLIEPAHRVKTAFCRPHGQVASEYPMTGNYDTQWGELTPIEYQKIEKPLAYMVCHGHNVTNAISGKYLRTI